MSFRHIICTAMAVVLVRVPVLTQDVTEPALKAAFIYNFAKFTEWPGDLLQAVDPFVMCVVGDAIVGEALNRTVKSRVLAGRKLTVSQVAPAGPLGVCHVLYVSGVPAAEAGRIVAALRGVPVLTISDLNGFTELGGIAQFFFEHGQLRFTIEHEAAKRARLQISSRLLALAKQM